MEEYGHDENGIPRLVIPSIRAYPFVKEVFVQLKTKSPEEVYFFMDEGCLTHPFALSKLLKKLNLDFERQTWGDENTLPEGDNYLLIGAGRVSRRKDSEKVILVKDKKSVAYSIGPHRDGLVDVAKKYLPQEFEFRLGNETIKGGFH
ncbi:hypothetical protein GOV13_02435 [Candidatus Pacearchaeota archaeon]|nr:hypothetical protein [Candidatus Pacearchaeota archaeon]